MHNYIRRGIKIGALKMHFVCILQSVWGKTRYFEHRKYRNLFAFSSICCISTKN